MNFPDVLTVTAFERETRRPVEGVALVLTLFAARKNDYGIGPVVTDRVGQARFTHRDCERSIAEAQKMFVMDYAGSLHDCRSHFEVRLHEPTSIAAMLDNYASHPEFWGLGFEDPERLFASLHDVKNAAFEPASLRTTDVEALLRPELTLLLRRRAV